MILTYLCVRRKENLGSQLHYFLNIVSLSLNQIHLEKKALCLSWIHFEVNVLSPTHPKNFGLIVILRLAFKDPTSITMFYWIETKVSNFTLLSLKRSFVSNTTNFFLQWRQYYHDIKRWYLICLQLPIHKNTLKMNSC